MEFKSKAHQSTYNSVKTWMHELFGETVIALDRFPVLILRNASADVQVVVSDWRENDAVIHSRSFLVKDVELTPELTEFLLTMNDRVVFGGFGVTGNGEIYFEHALAASGCNKEALRHSVLAVASTASKVCDEIVSRFGGRKMSDD